MWLHFINKCLLTHINSCNQESKDRVLSHRCFSSPWPSNFTFAMLQGHHHSVGRAPEAKMIQQQLSVASKLACLSSILLWESLITRARAKRKNSGGKVKKSDIFRKMDESRKYSVKWHNPNTKKAGIKCSLSCVDPNFYCFCICN